MFEQAGRDVVACETFQEAREVLLQSNVGVLLTDVRLGAFNGLQLAVVARQLDPRMRIVVFSGVDDPVLREEARRLAAIYLLKPLDPEHLLEISRPDPD